MALDAYHIGLAVPVQPAVFVEGGQQYDQFALFCHPLNGRAMLAIHLQDESMGGRLKNSIWTLFPFCWGGGTCSL